jgi:perosamine synthetase
MIKIPVNRPFINHDDESYVASAIKSGWISSEGPFVDEFESGMADFIGMKYAVSVNSGTSALEISLKVLDLPCGSEVIVPSFTIASCAFAIIRADLKPVFVDSYIDTWNMSVESIKNRISKNTRAILVVHTYGLPCEMDKILKLCKEEKLILIEDCAEAHGLMYKDKKCGSFGAISIFSFYANKHITTGEGGMILTNNKKYFEKAKKYRNLYFSSKIRYKHFNLGWNYRFTNIQAALGISQLKRIENTIKIKVKLGNNYRVLLSNLEEIQLPYMGNDKYFNNYWVFGVLLKGNLKKFRNRITNALKNKGIETRNFFYPLHKQPFLSQKNLSAQKNLLNAETLSETGFYLPSGVGTTENEVEITAKTLRNIIHAKQF